MTAPAGAAPAGAGAGALVKAVQDNCHIADARHAADLPLCTYLLQMREFYRWEQGLPFGAVLSRPDVGAWIAGREAWWADVEAHDYQRLPLDGVPGGCDPFDVRTVNDRLRGCGLLYGAGLVGPDRPVFFLADLHGRTRREGLDVDSGGRERARGLIAPPAALGHDGAQPYIVLRRESLARWCWEKFETFSLRRPEGSPFHAVVQAYGLDRDFEAALPRWLDEQGEAVVLHEIGEHRVGLRLGPAWSDLRMALPTRRGDLHARAVRDHLADLGTTLPTLLERAAEPLVHVWFAGFDGVREALFPSLKTAYADWRGGDGGQALRHAAARGAAHFMRLAEQALALHAEHGADAGSAVEQLLTSPSAVCLG